MTNKVIEIPVSTLDSLITGGKYRLRYRIKSKNGLGTSAWSSIKTISYPGANNNLSGQPSSFYELYLNASYRPFLSSDPHLNSPAEAYTVATVQNGNTTWFNYSGGDANWINSSIKSDEQDTGVYRYSWDALPEWAGVALKFDVYLSVKNLTNTTWTEFVFVGSTTNNSINFNVPRMTTQSIQAAVFLSSTPKLTSIANETAEVTLVSISPEFYTYYSATGTLGTVTGTAPYVSTITGLTGVPTGKSITGRKIFASGSRFGTGSVTVASTTSTTIVVHSTSALTAGAITNIRL
jgi:hypothetical protein